MDIISDNLQITCSLQCVQFVKCSARATGPCPVTLGTLLGGQPMTPVPLRGGLFKDATRGDVHVEEIRLSPLHPTSRGSLPGSPPRKRKREKVGGGGTADYWGCSCCSPCLSASVESRPGKLFWVQAPVTAVREFALGEIWGQDWQKGLVPIRGDLIRRSGGSRLARGEAVVFLS